MFEGFSAVGYVVCVYVCVFVCVCTLAISRGMMEIASGMLEAMPARALVNAVPLFSDTPTVQYHSVALRDGAVNRSDRDDRQGRSEAIRWAPDNPVNSLSIEGGASVTAQTCDGHVSDGEQGELHESHVC